MLCPLYKYVRLLFVFTVLIPHFLIAQIPPKFQYYTIADGLSNNYVTSIIQDHRGFMWFGTNEGLNRFDGYQFINYKFDPDNTERSLTNSWIEAIYEDKEGTIWAGTRNCISALNTVTGLIRNYSYRERLFVSSILPDEDVNKLWVGTDAGLFLLDKKTGNWQHYPLPFKNKIFIRSVIQDHYHRLWLTTYSDGVLVYDLKKRDYRQFIIPELDKHLSRSSAILGTSLLDRNNNLWITSWYSGLICINTVTEKITRYVHDDMNRFSIGGNGGKDLLEDADGKIWIAGLKDGCFIYDPSKDQFKNHPFDNIQGGLTGLEASSIYKGGNGIYWIGTDKGLNKYDATNQKIQTVSFSSSVNSSNTTDIIVNVILSIVKENDSLLWVGTRRGLYLINRVNDLALSKIILGKPYIYCVANCLLKDENGVLWIGGDGCLYKCVFNKRQNTFQATQLLPGKTKASLISLYNDHNGNMWAGTYHDGLFKLNIATGGCAHYMPSRLLHHQTNDNIISGIIPLHNGKLLIGTNGDGLCVLDPVNDSFTEVTLNDRGTISKTDNASVLSVIRDSKKNIWIATQFGGLFKTNDSLQRFEQITEKQGLPSLRIDDIKEDCMHNLWLTSLGRLILYNTGSGTINVFTSPYGLNGNNYLGQLYAFNDSVMLLGEENTLHIFNPKNFITNKEIPRVYVTSFKIFDNNQPVTENQAVKLNYDQNYFSFEYVGLSYSHTEHNMYAYMLEGLDKSWNYAGTARYASYANLGEGTYTFKVKASNSDGLWNENPATITIIIAPPFWHRWWFYTAGILLAAAVIYIMYSFKVSRLKKEMLMRDKISRDLHDDVGSTLSSIRFFSNAAQGTLGETDSKVLPLIKRIGAASDKILYSLDDIVWSINPKNDHIELIAARMTEFAAEILEAKNISFKIHIDEEVSNVKLNLATRHDFFLIYKEAINNLAKYSFADFVNISVKKEKNKLVLKIEDNGKGFDIDTVKQGNGLTSMHERARKIRARLNVNSAVNQGTIITLFCPLHN